MKEKVIKMLVKWGFSLESATGYCEGSNYEYASKNYRTPAKIATALINL